MSNSIFLTLHAAIAHVLHMSGAGEVLDLIIEKYSGLGPAVPSQVKNRTVDDYDLICAHWQIRVMS